MSDVQRRSETVATLDILARADVLSGLLFIAIAAFGLWAVAQLSGRHRAAHGHRLYAAAAVLGAARPRRGRSGAGACAQHAAPLRSVGRRRGARCISVTLSLVAFGLSIERLGLVVAILLLTGIGALATRALRPLETAIAALALIVLSWAIFIFGLGLTIPVWPDW